MDVALVFNPNSKLNDDEKSKLKKNIVRRSSYTYTSKSYCDLENLDTCVYDAVLIVGKYTKIENLNLPISWYILDNEDVCEDKLNDGYYDGIDNFFGKINRSVYNRFTTSTHRGDDIHYSFRYTSPIYISTCDVKLVVTSVINNIVSSLNIRNQLNASRMLEAGSSLLEILPSKEIDDITYDIICKQVMFSISGDPQTPYSIEFSKLLNKLKYSPNAYKSIMDIVSFYYENFALKNNKSIKFINTNFGDIHRSGWQYVINNIISLRPETNKCDQVIIDTYMDKTFGWSSSIYEAKKVIPYTSSWYGFLHHTNYSKLDYNINKTLNSPAFVKSSKQCKGIFVFTKDLQSQVISIIQDLLNSKTIKYNIPVWVVPYPTELEVLPFSMKDFTHNPKPKIVQIGSFLRDLFGIYRLEVDPNSKIHKAILTKNTIKIGNTDLDIDKLSIYEPKNICDIDIDDSLVQGVKDYIFEVEKSVQPLSRMSNKDYDILLSKNIVFLDLLDAAAVNTLVECIVRGTPVLVNKLPGVKEFLGNDYPFYYTSYYEASIKATNMNAIEQTNKYLKELDLSRYEVQELTDSLMTIIK